MNRRKFINDSSKLVSLGMTVGFGLPHISWVPKTNSSESIPVTQVRHTPTPIPENKRVPLGWPAFPLKSDRSETLLIFSDIRGRVSRRNKVYLRLIAALDFRERFTFKAYTGGSRKFIGEYEIIFAHPFQPFDFLIPTKFLQEIRKNGIILQMADGTLDYWFYGPNGGVDSRGLQPQLLLSEGPVPADAFFNTLYSMNSFAPFGWIGGCVIDALYEEHKQNNSKASTTLETHLSHFLDEDKGIIFENPSTIPIDGSFNSIEDILPIAAIVNLYPNHQAVSNALAYLKTKREANGLIRTGDITTEGCYTVGYPIAAIAAVRKDAQLAEMALEQITFRTKYLTGTDAIYQRYDTEGHQSYRNWGRGVAWYLLGSIKTIAILADSFPNLPGIDVSKQDFIKHATWVLQTQTKDGLWRGYVDNEDTIIDTSTSAGIATSFVWGYEMGLLDQTYFTAAKRCWNGLQNYLTSDGMLHGISQLNRAGEEFQMSDYRVISQFGLGLMAQLYSAIKKVEAI